MKVILQGLEGADKKLVKLFFIKKIHNRKENTVSYDFLKSIISLEIGDDLLVNAINQISKKIGKFEVQNYNILPASDEKIIETLPLKEVPHLLEFVDALSNKDLKMITDVDFSKTTGYIVRIENKSNTIYLFKRHTSNELLDKGKSSLVWGKEGSFSRIEDNIITIAKTYDAALLVPTPKTKDNFTTEEKLEFESSLVYIFEHSQFEYLFGFKEYFSSEITVNKMYLEESKLVESEETLIQCCGDDARRIRKLARILKNKGLHLLKLERIQSVISEWGLPVEFSKDNKMVVTQENIGQILHLLDDDFSKSEITDKLYKMYSKQEYAQK